MVKRMRSKAITVTKRNFMDAYLLRTGHGNVALLCIWFYAVTRFAWTALSISLPLLGSRTATQPRSNCTHILP